MERKLTENELQKVIDINSQYSSLFIELGQVSYRIDQDLKTKEFLTSKIASIQTQEEALAKELNEKYGKGSIDLNTGVIS